MGQYHKTFLPVGLKKASSFVSVSHFRLSKALRVSLEWNHVWYIDKRPSLLRGVIKTAVGFIVQAQSSLYFNA